MMLKCLNLNFTFRLLIPALKSMSPPQHHVSSATAPQNDVIRSSFCSFLGPYYDLWSIDYPKRSSWTFASNVKAIWWTWFFGSVAEGTQILSPPQHNWLFFSIISGDICLQWLEIIVTTKKEGLMISISFLLIFLHFYGLICKFRRYFFSKCPLRNRLTRNACWFAI